MYIISPWVLKIVHTTFFKIEKRDSNLMSKKLSNQSHAFWELLKSVVQNQSSKVGLLENYKYIKK